MSSGVKLLLKSIGAQPGDSTTEIPPPFEPPDPEDPEYDNQIVLSCSGGNGVMLLDWTVLTGTQSYLIYRSTTMGGPYDYIATVDAPLTNYTDTTVTPGTTYYYQVRASNTNGLISSNESSCVADELTGGYIVRTTGNNPAGGQYRPSPPGEAQAGDLLVAVGAIGNSAFNHLLPSGFTKIDDSKLGEARYSYIAYKVATASEPIDYIFDPGGGGAATASAYAVYLLRNINTTTPVHSFTVDTFGSGGASASPTGPTGIPAGSLVMVFFAGSADDVYITNGPVGYTVPGPVYVRNKQVGTEASHLAAYKEDHPGGDVGILNFTLSASTSGHVHVIAFDSA